jgi:hypothetical protein
VVVAAAAADTVVAEPVLVIQEMELLDHQDQLELQMLAVVADLDIMEMKFITREPVAMVEVLVLLEEAVQLDTHMLTDIME